MDLAISCLQYDAADFVTKPINHDILDAALKRIDEKLALRRQVRAYTQNLETLVHEKSARVVELERQLAAGQMVETLCQAMQGLSDDMNGAGYFNEMPCFIAVHNRSLEVVATNQLYKERLGDMHNIALAIAPNLARDLDLSGRHRLLDLGGGPGTYAAHFCRANPDLAATIYDLDSSRQFAEGVCRRLGVADRVTFIPGDYLRDPVPGGFDVVWMSQIFHAEPPEGCRLILEKAMHEPSLCLVAQGAKRILLGKEIYTYDAYHFLITAVDLPVVAQILEASRERPYLGLVLRLERRTISRMMVDNAVPLPPAQHSSRGMKKNRPATCVSLLCAGKDEARFTELLFRHTTTLGVKSFPLDKTVLDVRFERLETPLGPVTMVAIYRIEADTPQDAAATAAPAAGARPMTAGAGR